MSFALGHESNKSKTDDSSKKKLMPAKPTSSSQYPINNLAMDSSDPIIYLQRTGGNQAEPRPMRSSSAAGGFDFAKIRILQPKIEGQPAWRCL